MNQAQLMDRIYRYQRHLYDATRLFFLPGRDLLLRRMKFHGDAYILEIGCGTARNLRSLAQRHPRVHLYGVDISHQMLRTAQKKILDGGFHQIQLAQSSAEDFNSRKTFGLDRPFDVIFFSYSLSMIPGWQKSLQTAIANLRPGGEIYIVDFWDQQNWPGVLRWLMNRWLAIFHVRYDKKLIEYLQDLDQTNRWKLHLEPIGKRYAFFAQLSNMP
ncbi:MAG: class I SAM-dependent methyltransferase [Phycisphaerae bacterium]